MSLKERAAWIASLALVCACTQEVKMVEVMPATVSFTSSDQSEKLTAKGLDSRSAAIAGTTFTFRSEVGSVASVDADGLVKPVGNGSSAIVATAPNGVSGEAFVKVCLPKELICNPADELKLQVGEAGPVKCRVVDCKEQKIEAKIEYAAADKSIVRCEEDVFVGLAVGDTEVTITSLGLMKTVKIHVIEAIELPGMSSGGGGKGKGKGGGDKPSDPYGKGAYDHILKNMKMKPD